MLPDTQYKAEIGIMFGNLSVMIDWCQQHCESNWCYDIKDLAGKNPGQYVFFFESEKDLVNFILWKK